MIHISLKTKESTLEVAKQYYALSKPGIVYGNAYTTAGGLFFASAQTINLLLILSTLILICLIMAGACAINNAMDINIDSKMQRTNKRPTVSGKISSTKAYIFGITLSFTSLVLLLITTNILTFVLGLIALITYVPIYTSLKKTTWLATFVGAIPGALPPVAGYTAITNQIDANSIFIFATMFVWQMAHFYAIAL